MLDQIFKALNSPSPATYIAVFLLGIFVSFGSCTILEIPIIMGYINGLGSQNRRQIVTTVLLFILGMLTSYFLIGLAIGYAVVNLTAFSKISFAVYILVGAMSIIFGLYLLGFLRLPLPHIHLDAIASNEKTRKLGAFTLGFLFIFFEAPTCPSCAPALFVIASYMISKGTVLIGISLLMTYVLGQSIPVFFAATIAGFA
ncbi:MAG: sulfite exporter TauE/SafE family protein, partial [Actinobacteria bacterium]|nr:sulfite exporter TauE/SafE family protein [Actinomycetota bacterium]